MDVVSRVRNRRLARDQLGLPHPHVDLPPVRERGQPLDGGPAGRPARAVHGYLDDERRVPVVGGDRVTVPDRPHPPSLSREQALGQLPFVLVVADLDDQANPAVERSKCLRCHRSPSSVS